MVKLNIGILCCLAGFLACAKVHNFHDGFVGEWDAGAAGQGRRIMVSVRDDGTLTAGISGTDIKPLAGTWSIQGDLLSIKFPGLDMVYRIHAIDRERLVMRSLTTRITWHRVK